MPPFPQVSSGAPPLELRDFSAICEALARFYGTVGNARALDAATRRLKLDLTYSSCGRAREVYKLSFLRIRFSGPFGVAYCQWVMPKTLRKKDVPLLPANLNMDLCTCVLRARARARSAHPNP